MKKIFRIFISIFMIMGLVACDDQEVKDEVVKEEISSDEEVKDKEKEEVKEKILTVENCQDFAKILESGSSLEDYENFAEKYEGQVIEFDGRIDYCEYHENYKTRFDYLVSAGDYNPDIQIGPTFEFENVNYSNLHTDIPSVEVGMNVRIKAEIDKFVYDTGIFYLIPLEVSER